MGIPTLFFQRFSSVFSESYQRQYRKPANACVKCRIAGRKWLWFFLLNIFTFLGVQETLAQCNGFLNGDFEATNTSGAWSSADLNILYDSKASSNGLLLKTGLFSYPVQQTIYDLKPGVTYVISFDYYHRNGFCLSSELRIEVWKGGALIQGENFPKKTSLKGASLTFTTNENPADYTIKVIDQGFFTCGVFLDNFKIESPLELTYNANNVACNGANSGAVTINASGAARPYTGNYSKNGGAPVPFSFSGKTASLTNLSAGSYTISVTDANGCTQAIPAFSLTEPAPLSVSFTSSKDVSCFAGNDGATVLNVSGGTAPYSYAWLKDGLSIPNPNLSSLSSGVYQVTVTDAANCNPVTEILTIHQPAALTVTAAQNIIGCQGENGGSLSVNVNGGVAPYSFTLGGVTNDTGMFSGLAAGTYNINVTDANGCTASTTGKIISNPLPQIFTVTGGGSYCENNSGVIIGLSGSELGVNYQLKYEGTNAGSPIPGTGAAISFGLQTAAGNYSVSAENSSTSCRSVMAGNAAVNILPLPSLFNITGGGSYCFGSGGAPVGLTGSEKDVNYQLQKDGANIGSVVRGTGSAISFGLQPDAGIYTITATNSFLCSSIMTGSAKVTPSAPLSGSAVVTQAYTCLGTGTIQAQSVTGGTAPYQYSIDGITFESNDTFTGLTHGTYAVTIKDAAGCTFLTTPVTLDPLHPPADLTFAATAVTCPALTSDVTVSVTGGNAPFTYQIIAPSAVSNGGSNVFIGLSAGTYTFKVTDSKGCRFTESYTINAIVPIDVAGQLISNVSCFGGTDGESRFTISGFTGTYSYHINGGSIITGQSSATINLDGKPAGRYTITVTDEITNCTDVASIDIAEPAAALSLTAGVEPITCVANGSVTAAATGGWGGNQYSLLNPDGTTTGPQAAAQFTGLSQTGNYTLSVTDANGCVVTAGFTLSAPVPPAAVIDAASDLCFDSGNLATVVVGVTGGVSPYTYSINGAAAVNSNTFANLTPGIYSITVTDAYGCTSTVTQEVKSQLTATATLTRDLDCSASPQAVIQVAAAGGFAPYTYQVSIDGGAFVAATATYGTSSSGTYQFRIIDSRGCIILSNTIVIDPLTSPSASPLANNPTCNGSADGSINLNINTSLGTPPYKIRFNGSAFSSQTLYSGLKAGTYTYEIIDNKQCTFTGSVTLTEPAPLSGSAVITQAYTCLETGTIQAQSVTGGTAPYQYSIDGITFGSNDTFTGLTHGTYAVTIKDGAGCTFLTTPVTLDPLHPPADLTFAATAVTCPALTSDVTVSVTGGNAPFTYQIIAPSAVNNGGSNVFTGLSAGTYTFKVTDSKGCTFTESYTINAIVPIDVAGQLISNVSCFGGTDGEARFTISGFTGTYSYHINGGSIKTGQSSATINLDGKPAGRYTITVTDEITNCTDVASIDIAEPAAALSLTAGVEPITCVANGSVTAAAAGGWGGNQYSLLNPDGTTTGPQAAAQFTGLSQTGNYTLSVTDANGCVVTAGFTLSAPVPPAAVIDAASDLCFDSGNLATVVVGVTGGVSPYTYSINGAAAVNSNTFANLTPGMYSITVTDAYGCTSTVTQEVKSQLTATATLTRDLDCSASPQAVIQVAAAGGFAPYTYQVSIDGETAVSASLPFSTGTPGSYQFFVTDAKGCRTSSNLIVVTAATPPDITAVTQTQSIFCNGDAGAAIQVVLDNSKGTAPFNLSVNGRSFGTQTLITGLPAGAYEVVVTDARSCTDTETIIITEPAALNATVTAEAVSCTVGNVPGSITVNNSGGTAPYDYYLYNDNNVLVAPASIDNPLLTYTVANLNFGDYYAVIIDANGCQQRIGPVRVTSLVDLDVDISTITADCATGGTVRVSVPDGIGVGPFRFRVFPDGAYNSPNVSSRTHEFTGLIPGVRYTFEVIDDNTNCTYAEQASGPVNTSSSLSSVVTPMPVTCKGAADGSIKFTFAGWGGTTTSVGYKIYAAGTYPSNSSDPVLQSGTALTSGLQPVAVTGLHPGSYYILLTENGSGCSVQSANFNIVESQNDLVLNVSATADNCKVNAGVITATAKFGTAPYLYQFENSSATILQAYGSDNTFNSEAGNGFVIRVKDANGCEKSATIDVGLDPAPVISAEVTNQCSAADGDFTVSVKLITSGTVPYTYSLDGGAFQPHNIPFDYTGLAAGSHRIIIRDSNGCESENTVDIYAPLSIMPAVTRQPSCSGGDGVIEVSGFGGSGNASNYRYQLFDGVTPVGGQQTATTFTGLNAGVNYSVLITDVSIGTPSCTAQSNITLETSSPVLLDAPVVTNVTCTGGADGSIRVNLQPASAGVNDNPSYSYTLSDGINAPQIQNLPLFTGLKGGSYTLTVTSGRGCTASQVITIGEPAGITATATASAFSCNADNSITTSTITVSASGGTAPYSYSLDGVNFQTSNEFSIIDNGALQTVNLTVKDQTGCTGVTAVTVPPLPRITGVTVTENRAITCSNAANVKVTVAGGSGTYMFELLPGGPSVGPLTGTTADFDLPAIGDYRFRVTDQVTGCHIISAPYTVAPFDLIAVTATAKAPVNCFGGSDGSLNIEIAGYTGRYTYQVFNSAGTAVLSGTGTAPGIQEISGLAAGNYSVSVIESDAPFCNKSSNTITISSPASPLSLVLDDNLKANCNSGARVSVLAAGGNGDYSFAFVRDGVVPVPQDYSISNSAELASETSLQWDVYVKDAKGCEEKIDVTIESDPSPVVTAPDFASDQCSSDGASYSFTVAPASGLIAPLTYSIGSGFQTSPTFKVSSAGTYTVTIRDGNGCTGTDEMIIYAPLEVNATVTRQPSCSGGDGVIEVSGFGGSGNASNYLYQLFDGVTPVGGQQTATTFTGLNAGVNYSVLITDVSIGTPSCTAQTDITLETPSPVLLDAPVVTNVTCTGGADGSIRVNLHPASAGVNDNPSYSYTLSDGINAPQIQNLPLFTGLKGGSYTLTVTSGRGCTASQVITIGEPAGITATATASAFSCNADNSITTSTITVSASGGTAPYSYSVDGVNFQISNEFSIIDNGALQTINLTVKDQTGCTGVTAVTVPPLPRITGVTVTENGAITCSNAANAKVTVAGGSGTYMFELLPGGPSVGPLTGTTADFDLPAIGDYSFRVTDQVTGCHIISAPYTVAPFDLIAVTATAKAPVNCFGGSDGSLNIEIAGYTGSYTYQVFNSAGTAVLSGTGTAPGIQEISGLAAGNYSVSIIESDAPFCNKLSNVVTVSEPAVVTLASAAVTSAITCYGGSGVVTIVASGGTHPISYTFNGETNTSGIFRDVKAGLKQGYAITDAGNCAPVAGTIDVAEPSAIKVNSALITSPIRCNGGTATISLVASGGTAPLLYTFNGETNSTGIFTGVTAGEKQEYSISDANNCAPVPGWIDVAEPNEIVLRSALITEPILCNGGTGTVTIVATGGMLPLTYSFNGQTNTTGVFTGVAAGPAQQYNITDANNCGPLTGTIDIDEPAVLSLDSVTVTKPILCKGGAGELTIAVSGGTAPLSFTLNGQTNTTGVFSGILAGSSQVYSVTDANNCKIITGSIDFPEPPPLKLISASVTTPVLCNGSTATVTIIAIGGTAPVSYTFNGETNLIGIFSGVPAGPGQSFTISDGNICDPVIGTIDVYEPAVLSVKSAVVSSPILCNKGTGIVTIEASGGQAPIIYKFNGETNTTGIFAGITAGSGQVYEVTDGNNCAVVTGIIDVNEPVAIKVDSAYVSRPISCFGGTGNVIIRATGGAGPLTYHFNNETNSTGIFSGIAAGKQLSYTVSDVNNCYAVTGYIDMVGPGAPLEVKADVRNVTCFDGDNGQIDIAVTGGTAPYSYLWSVGEKSRKLTNRPAGSYTLTVTDSSGCQVTETYTINEPTAPLAATFAKTDISCFGASTGTIDVSVTGGTAPYRFRWSDNVTDKDRVALSTGSYTLEITDSNDCTIMDSIQILQPLAPLSASLTVNPTTCYNTHDGSVAAKISGGTPPYKIAWKGYSFADSVITRLAPGIYELVVSDQAGCSFEASAEVVATICSPAAMNDTYRSDQEAILNASVASNDSDGQQDKLFFTLKSDVRHGSLNLAADGEFTYTPSSGYVGRDVFEYEVCNTFGRCSSAKVTINVIPFTVIDLTPSVANVREGKKGIVTAKLLRPFKDDIVIELAYSGRAAQNDYTLLDQPQTMRIPAGSLMSTEKITIAALTDNRQEGDEDIIIRIVSTSDTLARIGTGSVIMINDIYPSDISSESVKNVPENINITPHPLVSPNGDGAGREFFSIENIISFPDNEVIIFNRFGNEVFRIRGYNESDRVFSGYANTGMASNVSEQLPDGVYYYIITTNRQFNGKQISNFNKGYLILKR